MKVHAWNNGSPNNKTGAGYGIAISKTDRDKYFKRSWEYVILQFEDGDNVKVKLSKSFWKDCVELRNQKIGRWLIKHTLTPWEIKNRPVLNLEPIGIKNFLLRNTKLYKEIQNSKYGITESKALQLVNWITEKSIKGIPPLCSAENLAKEYLIDNSYPDHEERIESLINWETAKNFTSGFVAGLGGIITLPVSIPAAFGASWIIQARMVAAIAKIAGYDINSDRVKTFILLCIVGDVMKDILKDTGIKISTNLSKTAIARIPGRVLIEINKRIGFRLITKAGEKGVINIIRGIPIIVAPISGAFDAIYCREVGKKAKKLFYAEGTN